MCTDSNHDAERERLERHQQRLNDDGLPAVVGGFVMLTAFLVIIGLKALGV